ncbi:MAG: ATP-binding protein [Candidatus Eremiobacteraeota bacterium]|nr:ATP-binding protein [Candidatus Eremiobacteraeota bacterium]MCW5865990.1 ATP-binding protein [Candidatus Eremiobacteraeota bacterium]
MLSRKVPLPGTPDHSFFLWGPRQIGKSSLLRSHYPGAPYRDLLITEVYLRYLQNPGLLREEMASAAAGQFIILDEIQKVPALLDEVHWLIENKGLHFGLCGSSARKVRRGHANLLGGRAVRYEMFGLVSAEIGADFDLTRALNQGNLPKHYLSQELHAKRLLRAYVQDYLTQEVAAEGLVRNLPAFSDFLRAAALSDSEVVNYTNIARDCGVSAPSVKEYFQILVDTLLGRFLNAYTRKAKRRSVQAPKFYFSSVGVVNALARRGRLEPGGELFGKALENWVCHELTAWLHYSESFLELSYWRLSSGQEVDFVIGDAEMALEVKAAARVDHHDLKGLRQFKLEYPQVKRRILISLDPMARRTDDGVELMPLSDFLGRLWQGEVVGP